jgi:hypothetical protein
MSLKQLFLFTILFIVAKNSAAISHINPKAKTYYINPNTGNDQNIGTVKSRAWKTFHQINHMQLPAGTTIEVLEGGTFHESIWIKAKGDAKAPVRLTFATGQYHLYPDHAEKRKLHISNTNDRPDELKALALILDSCSYVEVQGTGAKMILHGKMIETFVNHSKNISITGLAFDYNRPTVSELQVTDTGAHYAEVLIHPDSKYSIKDSLITWEGDGWRYQPGSYWQVLNPNTNDLSRISISMKTMRFVQMEGQKVRIFQKGNTVFKKGLVYQNRDVTRDCAAVFMQYSQNIHLKNIRLYFMHGMGVVSQYCQNIVVDQVVVKPDEKSGRTCAAWADILHFAGCSGKIEVKNSYLSAANDDAINVHGIHLKVTEILAKNKVRVRFMHDQTYGFDAFSKGDSVAFIDTKSLLSLQGNQITKAEKIDDKEYILNLSRPLTAEVKVNDAIENVTATPEVWIHHNLITRIPTRGILTTTRRKTVIEHNTFENTQMIAIFINNDASGWYESGMVKDVTIRQNKFLKCGGPIVSIHPENTVASQIAVHNNIKILNNDFWLQDGRLLEAKSTGNIQISGNRVHDAPVNSKIESLLKFTDCNHVNVMGNRVL